jgi:cytidylate kinase
LKKITIAIDGYSSCGKSTIAKQIAKEFGYIYVDSGAMYRAITLFALQRDYIIEGIVNKKLIDDLEAIKVSFILNDQGVPETILNGINVETEIRTPRISKNVSPVSAIKEVRQKLVARQQELGKLGGIVMDGRDIGTVVFPKADLKLFITASPDIRAERRFHELTQKGIKTTVKEVKESLLSRDEYDMNREESPLRQADDAILFDNSYLTKEEQHHKLIQIIKSVLDSSKFSLIH